MYYVYKLYTDSSDAVYVGMTSNPKARLRGHKHAANSGKKSKLYDHMRKHGVQTYKLEVLFETESKEQCCEKEIQLIEELGTLNLAAGGTGGYVVPLEKRESWVEKLKAARAGKQPALGMKHTEENKKLFSEVSKKYWETQDKYSAEEIAVPFKEANKKYGISRTHYYRLKRSLSSDQ